VHLQNLLLQHFTQNTINHPVLSPIPLHFHLLLNHCPSKFSVFTQTHHTTHDTVSEWVHGPCSGGGHLTTTNHTITWTSTSPQSISCRFF